MARTKKGDEHKTVRKNFYFCPSTFEKLEAAVHHDHISRSEWVNRAVLEKVERDSNAPHKEQPAETQTGDTSEICGLLRDILGEMRVIHLAVDGIRATNITAQIIKEDAEEADEATDEQVMFEFDEDETTESEPPISESSYRKSNTNRKEPRHLEDMRFYKTSEASKMVGMSNSRLRKYAKDGRIEAIKVGYDYRFSDDAIRRFLRAGRRALNEKGAAK